VDFCETTVYVQFSFIMQTVATSIFFGKMHIVLDKHCSWLFR